MDNNKYNNDNSDNDNHMDNNKYNNDNSDNDNHMDNNKYNNDNNDNDNVDEDRKKEKKDHYEILSFLYCNFMVTNFT